MINMIPINHNECNYSKGNQHDCCKHPSYCIFNKHRINMENMIHQLEIEQHQLNKDLEFINEEATDNCANYNDTISRLKIVNADLNRMKKFRANIIKKEDEKYGYFKQV